MNTGEFKSAGRFIQSVLRKQYREGGSGSGGGGEGAGGGGRDDVEKGLSRMNELNRMGKSFNNTSSYPNDVMFEYLWRKYYANPDRKYDYIDLMKQLEMAYYDYSDFFVKGKVKKGLYYDDEIARQKLRLHLDWVGISFTDFVERAFRDKHIGRNAGAGKWIETYSKYKLDKPTIGVFIFNKNFDQILLMAPANQRQGRGYTWGPPKGKVEGEEIEQINWKFAAIREVQEEIGINLSAYIEEDNVIVCDNINGKQVAHFIVSVDHLKIEDLEIQEEEVWAVCWRNFEGIFPLEDDHIKFVPEEEKKNIQCHEGRDKEYYYEIYHFLDSLKAMVEKIRTR